MKIFQAWVNKFLKIAAKRGAGKMLAAVSFAEAIFFPIPPDFLLIPIAIAQRKRAFVLAFQCLVFSILGGAVGYVIGYYFMDLIGNPIIEFYGLTEKYAVVQNWYEKYSAWAVAAAGLTPIPYKLCTLTAGFFKIDFFVFLIASTLSRGLRFFAIAALIYAFGEKVRFFLEKRFDWVVVTALALLVLGFVVLKFL
ncbi:MAG: VTT domain-containing protein [Thermodesulfobacteriota bacterium]|nr:VTT domain-containing protein [Thermodesulfobacteriota bacterium]